MKNNKKIVKKHQLQEIGVTLISLVVTIILLLILVGVAISQISGDNGLIGKAREASEKYKNSQVNEEIQISELEKFISNYKEKDNNEQNIKDEEINYSK